MHVYWALGRFWIGETLTSLQYLIKHLLFACEQEMQKITREVARELLRYVARAKISANFLDRNTTSAFELWKQLRTSRGTALNPKFQITMQQPPKGTNPVAEIEFVDGSKIVMNTAGSTVKILREEILSRAQEVQDDYERDGKVLEE
jgi:hypothetical protein